MKTKPLVAATLAAFVLVAAHAPSAVAAPPPAKGFVLSFGRATRKHDRVRDFVVSSGRFQRVVKELNDTFVLPSTVQIQFREGDGPQFDPDTNTITMNYDFVENVESIFGDDDEDTQEEFESNVLGVCEFVLYHEVGHALIRLYDLPITGREEDAVDSLATVIAVANERQDIALAEAELCAAWADEKEEFSQEDFWDEHSLDAQRTYSIVCLLYGSDPDTYSELTKAVEFDEDRESRCEDEWERTSKSWNKLLGPYLR